MGRKSTGSLRPLVSQRWMTTNNQSTHRHGRTSQSLSLVLPDVQRFSLQVLTRVVSIINDCILFKHDLTTQDVMGYSRSVKDPWSSIFEFICKLDSSHYIEDKDPDLDDYAPCILVGLNLKGSLRARAFALHPPYELQKRIIEFAENAAFNHVAKAL